MHLLHTVAELRRTLQPWRDAGEAIALVPTMGNLHAGHLSLVARARELAPRVVVSIFVNPLQFGPSEDFDRYPRTLEADCQQLREAQTDAVFAPSVRDMYPNGYPPATTVTVGGPLTEILCAPYRPGHFTGVATVVNMLFNLVAPHIALFGEKDYQQLAVIRRMVSDLGMPIRIVGVPTMREADGLAMSSRNQYLSAEERARAARIHETLSWVGEQLKRGRRDYGALQDEATQRLAAQGFVPQYVAIRAPDLSPPAETGREFVVLTAAYSGRTRLIDNLIIST